jgi:hypothetical protein
MSRVVSDTLFDHSLFDHSLFDHSLFLRRQPDAETAIRSAAAAVTNPTPISSLHSRL